MTTNRNLKDIMEQVIEYGKYTYEQEKLREDSLIKQAGHMLSAFSFSTAALYLLFPILLAGDINLSARFIYIWIGFISMFLILSLYFAMISLWRWKRKSMLNAGEFYDYVKTKESIFRNNDTAFQSEWKDMLTKNHRILKDQNNRRAIIIRLSAWSYLIAVLLILCGVINAIVIM